MIAPSLSARLGAAIASGAIAFTAMAGSAFAAGYGTSHSLSLGMGGNHVLNVDDDDCGHNVFDFDDDDCDHDIFDFDDDECGCTNSLGSCGNVGGFDVGDFFDAFNAGSANVSADADTTVNNVINAGSQNIIDVEQDGGFATADIDASASTTVNNEINAFSENNVSVNQE
jgi:hypothetical protein